MNQETFSPFEVVVECGLEARPKQHIDSVEKAVQHRHPAPLHHHRMRVGDLDHEEEPDAVTAGGEVALEIFDAQRQRPGEDLVESLEGLALHGLRKSAAMIVERNNSHGFPISS